MKNNIPFSYRGEVASAGSYVLINLVVLVFISIVHFSLISFGNGFAILANHGMWVGTLTQIVGAFGSVSITAVTLVSASVTIISIYVNKQEDYEPSFKDLSLLAIVRIFFIIATTLIFFEGVASFLLFFMSSVMHKYTFEIENVGTSVSLSVMFISSLILYIVVILIVPEVMKIFLTKEYLEQGELLVLEKDKSQFQRICEKIVVGLGDTELQTIQRSEYWKKYLLPNVLGFVFFTSLIILCRVFGSSDSFVVSIEKGTAGSFYVLIIGILIPLYLRYKQKENIRTDKVPYIIGRCFIWLVQFLMAIELFLSVYYSRSVTKILIIILVILLVVIGNSNWGCGSYKAFCMRNTYLNVTRKIDEIEKEINVLKQGMKEESKSLWIPEF